MSVADESKQQSIEGKSRANRKRPACIWVAIIGLVVLGVVTAAMAAGMMEPHPKRDILKAAEMSTIVDLEGRWEQTSLHCFEDDLAPPFGSRQAAHSIMYFSNGTSHLAITITVAEMESPEEANATYDGWLQAWSDIHENITARNIGDEGFASDFVDLNGTYDWPTYLHFHKGVYAVEMYFNGDVKEEGIYELIALDQAARL